MILAGFKRGERHIEGDQLFTFAGFHECTDEPPFFDGNSGAEMSTLGEDKLEYPESRIATIQQDKIMDSEVFEMAGRHVPFSSALRTDDGMCGHFVERIKHLRDPGHGNGIALPWVPHTEMIGNVRGGG